MQLSLSSQIVKECSPTKSLLGFTVHLKDVILPWPASEQSTVKYVGSKAFRPVLATPGPDTLTLFGWQPAPIFICGQKNPQTNKQKN